MKKTLLLKFSLFAFISAIICTIGNSVVALDALVFASTGLWFLAYLFMIIWLCQFLEGKLRYAANLKCLILSFALALYSGVMMSFDSESVFSVFYEIFLYLFTLICMVSAIVLLGRIIFRSPNSNNTEKTEVHPDFESVWVCSCGCANTGKFCSECGKPNIVAETTETADTQE